MHVCASWAYPANAADSEQRLGSVSAAQVANKPATLLLSGPAAGVGALDLARGALQTDNLLSLEIGGTSADVMLMERGTVPVSDQLRVGGYDTSLPSVDIHTIGAGGGTIASVDEAGLLRVGPQGAGAVPGPAAYGLGGTEPTVTDALLVLGRLQPGPYAGGAVTLDLDRAREAIDERSPHCSKSVSKTPRSASCAYSNKICCRRLSG